MKQNVAVMVHTDELECEIESGYSWMDCFQGIDLRRTEIAMVSFAGQPASGVAFVYNRTYFFEQAGVASTNAYKLNLGGTAIAFVGTLVAWWLMSTFGRRPIYVTGMASMSLVLLIIACIDFGRDVHLAIAWVQAGFAIFWLFVYSMTVGPISWAIPAEVSATRLRQKSVCLARISYYIGTILANVIESYMINPTEWNLRGKTGFLWCGTSFILTVWVYFRLPETRGPTFEEIDILFAKGVPARKFKQTELDVYDENNHRLMVHEKA